MSENLPTFLVQGEKSPTGSSHKASREDAFERGNDADEESSPSFIQRRMTLPASTSDFRKTLSEEAKLGDKAAEELEQRLKDIVSAFHARTKRTKEKIARPPTPSISESEDELTKVEDDDLLGRLRRLQSPGGSLFGGEERRKSVSQRVKGSLVRKLKTFWNFCTCHYILDADGWAYVSWLIIIAACFLYNAVVIPLRAVFPYQTEFNIRYWQVVDYSVDMLYILDIIAFKSHRKFLREGFWIKDPIETRKSYLDTLQFKIDLAALFPADILVAFTYGNYPLLRLPRLLKLDSYWELFQRFDTILASPHGARITKTLIYMLYMIHANACMYYGLSKLEGICATSWTYCTGNDPSSAYVRCFYFATKTATSIGKNPRPDNKMEYMYMTFAWLSGVFLTAILIGQIRDIIATATKNQNEYRAAVHAAMSYLHRLGVPKKLQNKVQLWLSYTWEQQKTLDESKILDLLPDTMRTDVALDLHVETLSKVKLFHHCEVPFLKELVCKLKSIIFLPGDYICRKGDVGREMFIIQSGKVNVIGGPSGTQILVTLTEGSVFGEIALLGVGGMNKRTADVRTAGFANLFVLHKAGLEEAIRDYPMSQTIINKKAKKLMKENMKKQKAAEQAARREAELSSRGTTSPDSVLGDEVIIYKREQPKLIETMKQLFPPQTKMGSYLSHGSKGVSTYMDDDNDLSLSSIPNDFLTSYPPTPFVPGSPNHISLELDISVMTGDSSEKQLSPRSLSPQEDERAESSSNDELKGYMEAEGDEDYDEYRNIERCSTPIPPDSPDEVPVLSSSSSREMLPLNLRPPVYPIVPGASGGVPLSSSEESVDEKGEKKKEMTPRTAALIASRFLTAMKRGPLRRQMSLDQDSPSKIAKKGDGENSGKGRRESSFGPESD